MKRMRAHRGRKFHYVEVEVDDVFFRSICGRLLRKAISFDKPSRRTKDPCVKCQRQRRKMLLVGIDPA